MGMELGRRIHHRYLERVNRISFILRISIHQLLSFDLILIIPVTIHKRLLEIMQDQEPLKRNTRIITTTTIAIPVLSVEHPVYFIRFERKSALRGYLCLEVEVKVGEDLVVEAG